LSEDGSSPSDLRRTGSNLFAQTKPIIKVEDINMNYDNQEGGAKTPKSSISLLSRESKNKNKQENINTVKKGQEIKLDLLQLALNNCESSIGPKKWKLDERTKTEKFQNFQKVLASREK